MGENTHQNCTRQNKNKEDPGRQQPCWGLLFCTNLTQPTGNLDSHTSEEVMELMQQVVRQQKKTLVMVTHDNHLATYADRVFHISDGKIIKIENHRKNEANKEEKKNE